MQISGQRSHTFAKPQLRRGKHWQFSYLAVTDVGRKRPLNEDFFLLHPDRDLYIVADGMGGHAGGEVASRLAGETIAAYFDKRDLPQAVAYQDPMSRHTVLPHHLVEAVESAHDAIVEAASRDVERRGMGTTVVALTFCGDRAYWAHVGDSRLYRMRDGSLEAMTRDHSLLEQQLELHMMTDEEARQFSEDFPYKNVLTQALGATDSVDVAVDSAPLQSDDLFVMTTDGIHDVIGESAIAELLSRYRHDLKKACEEVVVDANRAGGPDNITIACVEIRSADQ